MKSLRGTGVALITPFDEKGRVDQSALTKLVDYQIANGIEYLVVLGTTGESVTLTSEEKQQVIDTVIHANKGRIPLVIGIGGNNTAEIVREIKERDLSAFEAILSVSPAYNKPSQSGIYAHFAEIAKASSLPIILYNVPPRTSSNMLPETVAKLAKDFDNIIGVKEAAGDLIQAMRLIDSTPEGFMVISGDDMLALPMVLAGGAGVISVIGQGLPKEFAQMIRYGLDRKVDRAYAMHYKIAPAIDLIFAEGNPAGIKVMLEALEISHARVRLPLFAVSEGLRGKIKTFLDNF